MFDVSGTELIIILLVALVVFGPQRLPELARKVGGWARSVRDAATDLRQGLDDEVAGLREPMEEARRTVDDVKRSITGAGGEVTAVASLDRRWDEAALRPRSRRGVANATTAGRGRARQPMRWKPLRSSPRCGGWDRCRHPDRLRMMHTPISPPWRSVARPRVSSDRATERSPWLRASTTAVRGRHDEKRLPILEHLEELRWRIVKCAAVVLVGAIVAYLYRNQLIDLLRRPYEIAFPDGSPLVVLSPTEQFSTAMKVAIYGGHRPRQPGVVLSGVGVHQPGAHPAGAPLGNPAGGGFRPPVRRRDGVRLLGPAQGSRVPAADHPRRRVDAADRRIHVVRHQVPPRFRVGVRVPALPLRRGRHRAGVVRATRQGPPLGGAGDRGVGGGGDPDRRPPDAWHCWRSRSTSSTRPPSGWSDSCSGDDI